MQSIQKDVDLYIHRLIHESLTKELVREYHVIYRWDDSDNRYIILFKNTNRIAANFRPLNNTSLANMIRGLSKYEIEIRRNDNNEPVCLPKRYFFSSGMNSLTGYNNKSLYSYID